MILYKGYHETELHKFKQWLEASRSLEPKPVLSLSAHKLSTTTTFLQTKHILIFLTAFCLFAFIVILTALAERLLHSTVFLT